MVVASTGFSKNEYTVLLFVSILTRWRAFSSAERPCYSFYISHKTAIILDRLGYITKYWRTLSVSPRERYDFLVSICPVSLVSYRSTCSRGVEQWLQCRLPKRISSFGNTFDAQRPWSAIRLSDFWRRPCNGQWDLWFYGVFLDETDSERCTWR